MCWRSTRPSRVSPRSTPSSRRSWSCASSAAHQRGGRPCAWTFDADRRAALANGAHVPAHVPARVGLSPEDAPGRWVRSLAARRGTGCDATGRHRRQWWARSRRPGSRAAEARPGCGICLDCGLGCGPVRPRRRTAPGTGVVHSRQPRGEASRGEPCQSSIPQQSEASPPGFSPSTRATKDAPWWPKRRGLDSCLDRVRSAGWSALQLMDSTERHMALSRAAIRASVRALLGRGVRLPRASEPRAGRAGELLRPLGFLNLPRVTLLRDSSGTPHPQESTWNSN